MSKRKLTMALLGLFLCSMLLLVPIQPITQTQEETETSTFVISSWAYPDEYGQGITVVYVHENSSGVWLPFTSPAFIYPTDSEIVVVNATENKALRVGPTFTLNHSLHSLANITAGINIIRSNVSVYQLGVLIFSLDNATMVAGGVQTPTTYWYYAYIILNFLIVTNEIYTVSITYEVFY